MKKFKRVLAIALALGLTLSLSACNGQETPEPVTTPEAEVGAETDPVKEETPASDKVVNVGVAIYLFNDNFMTLYRQELQRVFEEELSARDGVEYKVTVQDGKNDQAEQTNQIDNFIAEDYDVLIVNLVQSSAGQTIVDKCKDADIPVVFINREPEPEVLASWDKATYVGADARQSGTYQGEIILETETAGDINGDGVISYVMVQGDPENVDAQYRTAESVKALTDAGKEVNELANERGDWQQERGQEILTNALTQHGEDIEVVFCNNDGMALGAKQAIEAAGRVINKDIYLVGVDALPEAIDFINEDAWTGTVFNDHLNQSATAAVTAIKAVNGESLDDLYQVNYIKITPDNSKTYLEEAEVEQAKILKD